MRSHLALLSAILAAPVLAWAEPSRFDGDWLVSLATRGTGSWTTIRTCAFTFERR